MYRWWCFSDTGKKWNAFHSGQRFLEWVFGMRRCGGGSELSERAPSFMILEQIQPGLAKTGLSRLAAHTCSAETFKMLAVNLLGDLLPRAHLVQMQDSFILWYGRYDALWQAALHTYISTLQGLGLNPSEVVQEEGKVATGSDADPGRG